MPADPPAARSTKAIAAEKRKENRMREELRTDVTDLTQCAWTMT